MSDLPCGYCQKSFATLRAMKSHIDSVHGKPDDMKEEEFPAKNVIFLEAGSSGGVDESPDAKREDDDDDNWKLSSSVIEDFECFPCQLRFGTELGLQDHIGEKHCISRENKTKVVKRQIKKHKKKASMKINSTFTCDTIRDISRLENKTEKSTSSNDSNLVIVSDVGNNPQKTEKDSDLQKKNSCEQPFDPITSVSFEADTKAKLHQKDNLKTDEKSASNWICSICGKTFEFRSRLARHSIIHNSEHQERQFECPTCQKKFLRSGKTRTNEVR